MDLRKKFFLRTAACFVLAGVPLAVQGQERPAPKEPETNSRYVSEEPENSGLVVLFHSTASRDNNILGNNASRLEDYVFEEGALFSIWANKPEWRVGLDYRPNALIYRTYGTLNQFDQRLDFNNEFHAARHLIFRLKDSVDYTTGVLEPQTNGEMSLPSGGSPNLNTTVVTPFARVFANDSSGEAEYQMDNRSSFHFSGGYGFRRFTGVGNTNLGVVPNLFNTQSDGGGGSYAYRVTRHFTAGLEYQFQDYRFSQSSRDKTHRVFLSVLWDTSPHVTIAIFAGAEHSDSEGQFLIPSTNVTAVRTTQWSPGGGASLTFRSNQTVFRLTGQKLVADGGGLLPAVTNSFEAAEVRRRMARAWDVMLTLSNGRSVALQGPMGKGKVDTQAAGMAIEHPLFQNLSVHLGYNYLRQRTNQFVPFAFNADRDRFTVGLFYRSHEYRF
jgi:hypothetical protein